MKSSLLLLAVGVLSVSCGHIAAYEQELRAAEEARSERPKPAPRLSHAARSLHLRAYVDASYRAEHANFRASVEEVIEMANLLIGPQLDTALHLDGIRPWDRECETTDVAACLDELERLDAGAQDVWVVAFTGSLPVLTRELDALGHARPLGRHVLMHGMGKLDAGDDFGLGAGRELRQAELRAREQERRRHKGALVFMHAFSHSLGSLHSNEAATVMHASYNPEQAAFGPDTSELAIEMIDATLGGALLEEQRVTYRAWLEEHPTSFLAEERAQRLAELSAVQKADGASARSRELDRSELESALVALSERDRALLADARASAQAGMTEKALASALELAQRYPDVAPLQLFACDLVRQRNEAGTPVASPCSRAHALVEQSAPPAAP